MISFPTELTQFNKKATIRAGGTDIQARINGGIFPTRDIISLRDIPELNGVSKREEDNEAPARGSRGGTKKRSLLDSEKCGILVGRGA